MSTFIVLGAGTFAQDLTDMLVEDGHNVAGYVVNVGEWSPGMRFLDRPVYDVRVYPANWPDEGWPQFPFLPAIISPRRRLLVEQMLNRRFHIREAFVHHSASVSASAKVNPGSVVSRCAVVACGSVVHSNVIINRSASIGHHVQIGQGATIGPGAILCGNVMVGCFAVIGAGAIVLEDRRIGQHAQVGAGAVVTKDVDAETTVYGVPAREPSEVMPAMDW